MDIIIEGNDPINGKRVNLSFEAEQMLTITWYEDYILIGCYLVYERINGNKEGLLKKSLIAETQGKLLHYAIDVYVKNPKIIVQNADGGVSMNGDVIFYARDYDADEIEEDWGD